MVKYLRMDCFLFVAVLLYFSFFFPFININGDSFVHFFFFILFIVFFLLPFFFIFRSSSPLEILIGITLLILFFLSYMFSFKSKSGLVYMWLSFEIIINIAMTLLFSFVYFSLFTAFFI